MKTFVVLIACVFGLVAAQTTTEPAPTPDPNFSCPNDDESGGYYAHPESCSKYYECANGLAWLFQCSAGLQFFEDLQRCDWPDGTCEDGVTEIMPKLVRGQECLYATDNYTCEVDMKGAYPHEEFCEYYYDCYEEQATLCRCTDGYLFDLTYMGCNYPKDTFCGDRLRPNGTTDPTTTTRRPTTTRLPGTGPTEDPPAEFVCPEEDGLYANPEDCSSFYQCVAEIPFLNHCPDNLVWNQAAQYCDFKANVPECQ